MSQQYEPLFISILNGLSKTMAFLFLWKGALSIGKKQLKFGKIKQ